MTGKIISVVNMKGGVGKTTMTCNLAYELREDYKVLVIDIDPQFNSTQAFINLKHEGFDKYFDLKEKNLTIAEIFNEKRSKQIVKRNELTEEEFYKEIIHKIDNNLDIIPGDLELIVDINANSDDKLKAFFNTLNLVEKYDFIFFDCPPTWSHLTNLAIGISDYYLIPSKLDDFSAIGIDILLEKITGKVKANPDKYPVCLGVIYTFLNPRATEGTSTGDKLTTFKESLNDIYSLHEDGVKCKISPFNTTINYSQPIATKSIIYDKLENKYSILKDNVKNIKSELIERLNGGE
ncbi:AAA family ATPase [Mammaliicoccus sciuri]|uniref:ParA family protein n=1 Tax=Mammaliicoccus sciuri TaxID=1296 RepID=UPI0011892A9A|nr:AAA family ATPase [Mammaliicoccus sciuri]QDR64971.1 AAA family ATPase [Mammaliicoccus sciuri]